MAKIVETPLMKQYNQIKEQYPDAVLLFRVGDFYETFSDDAILTSEILGITLTRRANGVAQYVELAGFPHHALDTYLPKLVRHGLRVAICDQLEDPKLVKGLVKRGVTELVTPGVSVNENILNVKENNFLASIVLDKNKVGVSFLDISTGEFLVTEGQPEYIEKIIHSFSPKEILYECDKKSEAITLLGNNTKYYFQQMPDWVYSIDSAKDRLTKHFDVKNLKGFGVTDLKLGVIAAGAILYYLDQTHHDNLGHITQLTRIQGDRYVWMDDFTIRNLELVSTIHPDGKSLYDIIDKTITPMGGRLLKRMILFPLKNIQLINDRLSVVTHLFKDAERRDILIQELSKMGDLERIISKIVVGRINPREVYQLQIALSAVERIKTLFADVECPAFAAIIDRLNPCKELQNRIVRELNEDLPSLVSKGGIIARGVSKELDELREISTNSKDFLLQLQQREIENTGIPSLKIGYTNVFGYYFEVRNTHKDKVPASWIRKQTLVNAERYITEELKVYEEKILGAEERIGDLESQLFDELVQYAIGYVAAIQLNCTEIANLDCLQSFTEISIQNNYFCPVISGDNVLDIKAGRHPVIEKQLAETEEYVPNDVFLDNEKQQIIILTGPNMAGKSALLRQTALIVLLAQMGCYVPAQSAKIGIVDKIFTRVGASDNISSGDSTFMVEMTEASIILNNLTDRSLLLFDELGRGTSTYDGISIAWSIIEYIHEKKNARAKTLFATHYHELNEMEKRFCRIKNFNVSVKEVDNKVIFLRKLVPGGSEHSFGIHVAKMAGMPKSVVNRADEILKRLEKDNKCVLNGDNITKKSAAGGVQLNLFQLDDPILAAVRDEIINLNIDSLTPVEALLKLNEIKKIVLGK
ncbi:MAG: DNA mismatch repair protein MutS [Bacteroidales bacterium]|nr:DNA mismatch repair protein MutS [Bacteroidales bacterium]MDY5194004.1 DNA mismatch repair protein MutS [Candidatus Aphodosoma sp.]